MRVLAIDPGNVESGYALIDAETRRPIEVGKIANHELRGALLDGQLSDGIEVGAIEMVASYGMAVGKEVFETCVWIGRFIEASGLGLAPIYRRDVKLHHCGSAKAKDANIVQALVDRFASGEPNRGKGTKAEPGFFYGFRADIWQAMALAVMVADRIEGVHP
ncbi:MAG TPA: hypothetical protein VFJ94_03940 [Intrasporangium sp.]|uniref:hypothetical protein n=1 Tax=Intrasporangium sp. TaxID=1925024 RepID=UPI002D78A068|nr:hypothetical protein [Intrasporangium sp.]HET7397654.1 hypothetical protein [Intrasporangium sp.]